LPTDAAVVQQVGLHIKTRWWRRGWRRVL